MLSPPTPQGTSATALVDKEQFYFSWKQNLWGSKCEINWVEMFRVAGCKVNKTAYLLIVGFQALHNPRYSKLVISLGAV